MSESGGNFDPMSAAGMTPGERALCDQVWSTFVDHEALKARVDIEAHDAAGAFRDFGAAIQVMDLSMALDEAEEVATHPDLVELNVAMDGWYA